MAANERILYVATGKSGGTAEHRLWALRRLGYDVVLADSDVVLADSDVVLAGLSRVGNWLTIRTQMGPRVTAFNRALIEKAKSGHYDLVWFDKALFVHPDTVDAFASAGVTTVHCNVDNPFSPRNDPGWGLFLKALPKYDIHVVPREKNLNDYRTAGARRVILMPLGFEPTVHFPPPNGWSEADRPIDVGFIGTPYDNRKKFIEELWRKHGIVTRVRGLRWDRLLVGPAREALYEGGPVYNDDYREAMWRCKILLGFVTWSNGDTYAHRCYEIAGCGGFMLAQRAARSVTEFEEGKEAAFFDDVDECAENIRRYLSDETVRVQVGRAGHERAIASGYDNDSRIRRVMEQISE